MSDTVVIQGGYLINIHWPLHAGDVLLVVFEDLYDENGKRDKKDDR
jgi:hypothetical protein